MWRPIVQYIWTGLRLKVFWVLFPLKRNFFLLLNGTFLVWKLSLHNFRQKNLSVSGCAVRIDVEHSVKHSIRKVIRKNFQGRKWISTHCFSKIIFINGNLWWLFQNKITKFHGPQSYISRSAHTMRILNCLFTFFQVNTLK